MRQLASALYCRHKHRPAIVVGGGPSAPQQLEYLRKQGADYLVLSANGHAVKLGLQPDYIVCKDHKHTETKALMEPMLREIGAPLLARHYWADYRLARWPIQGNSGMMALGAAALMGCAPIFPIGFDCYQGATYFHAPTERNVSLGLRDSQWRSRYQRLGAKLVTADIRLLGQSPLVAAFRRHDPQEAPRAWCMPPVLEVYRGMATCYVKAKREFPMLQDPTCPVPRGEVFPVDAEELARLQRADLVDLVDNPASL